MGATAITAIANLRLQNHKQSRCSHIRTVSGAKLRTVKLDEVRRQKKKLHGPSPTMILENCTIAADNFNGEGEQEHLFRLRSTDTQ